MRLFLLSVVFGVLLVTTAQAKSEKAPPKKGTPPASSPSVAAPAPSAPEPPWVQMEMTPLEKEIVKQHLADIRAVQSKKPTKKVAPGAKLPPGWQKKLPAVKSCHKRSMLRRSHCLKSSYGHCLRHQQERCW